MNKESKAPLYAVMYSEHGCDLGTFDLDEVARLFMNGEVEPGDRFVVREPDED